MHSIAPLLTHLRIDYPLFSFVKAVDFSWSPSKQTIYYTTGETDTGHTIAFLLHELSHAVLSHADYNRDIELINMERQAWDKAKELASTYSVRIDDDIIETTLDSYRDWLHARSTCPNCSATGIQIKNRTYNCPVCHGQWRVNEARICALRRYKM